MTVSPGRKKVGSNHVCKLVKSLYGLKQASREWNAEFTRQPLSFSFLLSQIGHCLFLKSSGTEFLCILVYISDVLVCVPSQHIIDELKGFFHHTFTIKDLGPIRYILGMDIARCSSGVSLNQRKYVLDIVYSAGLIRCRLALTHFSCRIISIQA